MRSPVSTKPRQYGHPPRIMILTESAEGFGHFNVVDQVSQKLQEAGAEVAIASGTLWHAKASFDFPGTKKYNLHTIGLNPDGEAPEDLEQREATVTEAVRDFQPDIIVDELYPFLMDFRDADLHALENAYQGKPKPKLICLCRDIVHGDNPDAVAKTVSTLNEHFDHVLVRGDGIMNRLEDCEAEWGEIDIPVEYMGNIVRKMPSADVMPEQERPVLVGLSGGWSDAERAFFERAMESRRYSQHFSQNPWKLVISNSCPESIFNQLVAKAEQEDPKGKIIVTRPYSKTDISKEQANCAAAIIRGGYNTVSELVFCERPFVIIPHSSSATAEGNIRADMLEQRGLAKKFPSENLAGDVAPEQAAQKLAETLDAVKISKEASQEKPAYNGDERMATRLIELAYRNRHFNAEQAAEQNVASRWR